MKNVHLKRKLFTTTLLTGCIITGITPAENAMAVSKTYTSAHSNTIVTDDPLPYDRISMNGVQNITFEGAINTSNNIVSINNSTPTFNNTVTSNNSSTGVAIRHTSTSIFNGSVTANYNTNRGIDNWGESTFYGGVTVNNNKYYGIFNDTNMTFHGEVIANYNTGHGIFSQSGNITFYKNVTANNNTDGGIYNNDNITFYGNVTVTGNGNSRDIYSFSSSGPTRTITFNNDKIITGNIAGGNVIFSDGPTINNSIRSSIVQFTSTDPLKRASLHADIYSTNIKLYGLQIGIDDPVVISGTTITTYGTRLDLTNAPLTISCNMIDGGSSGVTLVGNEILTFSSNKTLTDVIVPSSDNNGNIVFSNVPTINTALGAPSKNLASVKFTSNSGRASLKNDIYANSIEFKGLEVGIDSALTLKAPITANNTRFDLTNKSLTIANNLTNIGNSNVTLKGSNPLIFSGDNVIDASIVPIINGAGSINFTGAPTINRSLGSSSFKYANISFTYPDADKRTSLRGDMYTNSLMFGGIVPYNLCNKEGNKYLKSGNESYNRIFLSNELAI